jgi:hypothetical protein
MFASRLRLAGIVLALSLPLLASGINSWSTNLPRASAAAPPDTRMTTLLRERLATLQEIAAQATGAFERGSASVMEVHAANEAVLRAELDLADSQKARIAIHEKLVMEAKKHEEHVARIAMDQSFMLLRAKVHRLEAEIALEREKAKQPEK